MQPQKAFGSFNGTITTGFAGSTATSTIAFPNVGDYMLTWEFESAGGDGPAAAVNSGFAVSGAVGCAANGNAIECGAALNKVLAWLMIRVTSAGGTITISFPSIAGWTGGNSLTFMRQFLVRLPAYHVAKPTLESKVAEAVEAALAARDEKLRRPSLKRSSSPTPSVREVKDEKGDKWVKIAKPEHKGGPNLPFGPEPENWLGLGGSAADDPHAWSHNHEYSDSHPELCGRQHPWTLALSSKDEDVWLVHDCHINSVGHMQRLSRKWADHARILQTIEDSHYAKRDAVFWWHGDLITVPFSSNIHALRLLMARDSIELAPLRNLFNEFAPQ